MENIKEENKIIKVVFYQIEIQGKRYEQALVFTTKGISIRNKEKGIDALYQLAKEKNIKTKEELNKSNCYKVLSEDMLKKQYPSIYNKIRKLNKKEKKSSLKEILSKFKIKKLSIRTALITLATLLGLAGGTGIGFVIANKFNNKKSNEDKSKKENTVDNVVPTTEEINDIKIEPETAEEMLQKYVSVNDILEKSDINKTKANTINRIWSYLKNYNKTISKKHKSSVSDTRLAHTWDEAVVYYLSYNDISKEELVSVFDGYNIDLDIFEEAYKNGFNQDIQAYTVLKKSTKKVNLINSQEGKDFYTKYEDLIIKYNQNFDKEHDEVETIVNEFTNTVRNDFDINSPIENIESYKLSVIPIIQAFNDMTENRNFDSILTDEEMSYFDELSHFDMVEDKINDLANSLNAYNMATNAVGELQEEYTYSQIKDAAITELDNDNAYNVTNSERDISDHNEFKEKFIKEEKVTKTYNNYNYTTNNSVVDQAGIIIDNEEDEEIPDWMLENDDQEDVEEEEYIPDSENVDDVEEDTPDSTNVDEVEEDTPAILEPDEETNTDDSVKDITPDETGEISIDSLPDPNNEAINYESYSETNNYKSYNDVVADMIINEMANEHSVSESGYQYTKK